MKNRYELPQIYINFAKIIQTRFSKIIKKNRPDITMDYCTSKLLYCFGEQGTLFDFFCPYTSQQNGCAERKYCHILDLVCVMLISALAPNM